MPNTILVDDWLAVIQDEYLGRFIRRGGAAVKFAVLSEESRCEELVTRLKDIAKRADFSFVSVDVATTKAHMIDKMFFAFAHQIPWDDLTTSFLRSAISKDYFIPEDQPMSIETLASVNGLDTIEMRRNINNRLTNIVFHNHRMAMEFRIAMLRLCQAQLDPRGSVPGQTEAIRQWLCGELRLISTLKAALIFQKIGRHNARDMMYSLCHWLYLAGKAGLVVTIDISRYLESKRQTGGDGSLYYGTPAVLDGYEVLRQFIDSTDDLERCLVVVLTPPSFLDGEAPRGIGLYEALRLRVWDEVHDMKRVNPLSPLIRLRNAEASPHRSGTREGLL